MVLAGPNNSGKTTLLQAIATWDLAIRKWSEEKCNGVRCIHPEIGEKLDTLQAILEGGRRPDQRQ